MSAPLLTAEQFVERYPNHRVELVKGHVVPVPPGSALHGATCACAAFAISRYVKEHDIGHVTIADSWVITERRPDSVRGADISYYSYGRLPPGPLPDGILNVVPDLIIEVLETSLGWSTLFQKLGEYLDAGVRSVILLDPRTRMLSRHEADGPGRVFNSADTLTIPEVLPGFAILVKKFFE